MARMFGPALIVATLAGCGTAPGPTGEAPVVRPQEWALAVHAGAGVISASMNEENREEYLASLREALTIGRRVLSGGGTGLDAVEQVLTFLEDDPKFNAGRGAVYNHDGGHELDASIMDGSTLACGAVAGVTSVKNPIILARRVMERSPHVLLAGAGAERFADEMGVERVRQEYFHTERRRQQWLKKLEEQKAGTGPGDHGTAGVVALDRHGNLAAGTTTGGITGKRFGRIGDSPIIGAGTYADNATCGISGTGRGEEFIRHNVARRIASLMEDRRLSLQEAAEQVVLRTLKSGDGGIIGVDRDGAIAMVFNTEGMFRGAADAGGRFEVAIWE